MHEKIKSVAHVLGFGSVKALLLSLVFLFPLIFFIGYLVGPSTANFFETKSNKESSESSERFIRSRFALSQYHSANYDRAKGALEEYLRFLEKPQPENSIYSVELRRFYSMITWGRLARLEERKNNIAAASKAWEKAEQLANQAHFKNPNRAFLQTILGSDNSN